MAGASAIKGKDDVIFNTPIRIGTVCWQLIRTPSFRQAVKNVGLPDGQMGNSEVGHLNIGAGTHRLPGFGED